ncbi:MAG: DUF1664 domain-containing protein [Oscillospiraceae bacterium]|nr:DUF1664 domain-containing protein [Oscillospiraceae bacterium]
MENEMLQKILNELQEMKDDIAEIKDDVAVIRDDIAVMKDDIAEIKEHAEITRDATNELTKWVDQASPTVHVEFPYKKREIT